MALALTSRRSTVAAITSAVAAMAFAAAVAGRGCRVTEPGPEAAVRDMVRLAKSGDREAVFDLLSPQTQERLRVEAKKATDLVASATRYTARDLISIGNSDNVPPPSDITLIDESGDTATVEVVSPAGRARVRLVRIDGRWRIDLAGYPGQM
jgi:hypothetical protein